MARVALVSGLLLLGAACAGDVIGDYPSPPAPAITASSSPEGDDRGILAEIAVEGSPCDLAEAGGRVWVTAFDGNELAEIDPGTNEVVGTYRMPNGPCGMEARQGVLWIESGNTLVRFDPERGEGIDRLRVEGSVFGLTSTPSGLWGMGGRDEQVVRLDPRSGRIVGRVHVEGPLTGLAADGDEVWTISGREALVRIDPQTETIEQRFVIESFEPEGLAIDGNTLWVSSSFEGDVLRVDARTGGVEERIAVDGSLFGGVVVGDPYWVAGNDGTVYRIDTGSGEVQDQLELVGFGPVAAAGNLWTVDLLTDTVFRLDEPGG